MVGYVGSLLVKKLVEKKKRFGARFFIYAPQEVFSGFYESEFFSN